MKSKFDFNSNLVLEDDVVLLRPLQETDYESLVTFSINEPELWKYSLIGADGAENLKNYLQIASQGRQNKTEFPFLVYDKKSGSVAGSTRFYDINFPFKTLQLGYTWYGKKFQGTGLNKHCKFLLLSYAFEILEMERVEFRADNDNVRSIAAMKSIGCKVDGILRNSMPKPEGGRRDSIVLSILRSEWLSEVKENLKSRL